MDFRLPARSGQGEPLTQAALDALIREHQLAVFFSKDLFARYFTYAKNGESHFILFDDADTLRQKLRLGRQLGVAAAFFQWPEVCDIADSLFRRKVKKKYRTSRCGTFCFLVETLLVLTSSLRLLATLHAGAFIMLSLANLGDNCLP